MRPLDICVGCVQVASLALNSNSSRQTSHGSGRWVRTTKPERPWRRRQHSQARLCTRTRGLIAVVVAAAVPDGCRQARWMPGSRRSIVRFRRSTLFKHRQRTVLTPLGSHRTDLRRSAEVAPAPVPDGRMARVEAALEETCLAMGDGYAPVEAGWKA